MEGARGRLARGVAWIGAARVLINLFSFVSTIILARLLMPEDFGLVAIVAAAATIVTSLTELSLTQALIAEKDLQEDDFRSAWTLNLLRAAVLALIMAGCAIPLADAYGEQRLVALFLVMAAGCFVGALENPKLVIFQRDLVFSQVFVVQVTERLLASVVAIVIALIYQTYWALVVGTIVGTTARVVVSYFMVPFRPHLTLVRSRGLLSFSLWLTLGNLVKTANMRSIPLVIAAVLPTTAVGVFSLADRMSNTPLRESMGAIQNALFPAYARIAGDAARLRSAYLRSQAISSAIALPLGFGMAAVAEPLVHAFVGAKWQPAVPVIAILAVASALAATQNALALAMATRQPEQILYRNLRTFAIQFPLLAAGYWIGSVTEIGPFLGLVAGQGCSSLVNTGLNYGLVRKIAGIAIRDQFAAIARPLVAAAAMTVAALLFLEVLMERGSDEASLQTLLLACAFGATTYAFVLALLVMLTGKRDSPERELFGMARSFLQRK